ncbi:MAG: TonB-dependent receptor, partial [Prevotella shahii]|nr:TonB-dependent receptor [Hoylesella shahii]
MQKRLFFLFAIVMFLTSPLMAQVTTSGINGKVVAGSEEVIGATVVAVHTPSGTRYNGITNEKGRYSIQGMRVGGPYTITISYVGYKDEVFENINLVLGETSVLNADMKEDAKLLGEVTVTVKAGVGTTGASTQFSKAQIDNTPTVNRNIYDVATLSPLVKANKKGGITIAGTNNRYNSFQIDGMVSNDVFGLSSGGTIGDQTNANPIALDAVEQIQVVASPFDIRQSGFTGGAINAITKSGTNDFKASAYTYYTNENLYGQWNQNTGLKEKYQNESTKTFGATFGGPILKDKLFFFASAEYK